MVFVINSLKYDTEKMDLVSDKTKAKVDLIGLDLMLAQRINNDPSIICDINTLLTKENIQRSICPGCERMILGTRTDIENNITFVDVL